MGSGCLESALIVGSCTKKKRGHRIIFIAKGGATSDAHVVNWTRGEIVAGRCIGHSEPGVWWKFLERSGSSLDTRERETGQALQLAWSIVIGPRVLFKIKSNHCLLCHVFWREGWEFFEHFDLILIVGKSLFVCHKYPRDC